MGHIEVLNVSYETSRENFVVKLIGYARVSTRRNSPSTATKLTFLPPVSATMISTSTKACPGLEHHAYSSIGPSKL